jgi:hypothetical protein
VHISPDIASDSRRFPASRIDTGKYMSEPPQPNEPEQASPNEVQQRGENPALDQLTQARDKKTHERGNDITRRTLLHTNVEKWVSFRAIVNLVG